MNFILRCHDLSLTDTTSSEDENTEFYDAQCGESSEPSSVSNFAKYNKIENNKLVKKKKVKQKNKGLLRYRATAYATTEVGPVG